MQKRQAIDFEKELNAEQLAVVMNGDGPCVVLAGAGSGKTRTIVYRVAYLVERGVRPEQILLLTFTNKAAGEMMTRIGELLGHAPSPGLRGGGQPARIWGGTFHSIANRILRAYAERAGYTPAFSILDADDGKTLVKAVMRELGIGAGDKRFPSPLFVQEILSYARNAMVGLDAAVIKKHPRFEPLLPEFRRIADAYDAKKRAANAMDFDDLLVRLHHLLSTDASARERLATQFRYVLVDEYQDTNPLQASIVALLAGPERNVLVVGDDAQSIYSFRAADVRNILDFPKHYPDARIFKLETNYRSTPEILGLANDVISRNIEQFPKRLKSVLEGDTKPVVVPTGSAAQEAAFVATRIEDLLRQGVTPDRIAVLFRATFHSQALEFELMKRGMEYDYRGGVKFFDRAHVKDALAFLRIAANFSDEAAWLRVLGFQVGIGEVMASRIYSLMRQAGSLAAAVLAPVEQACGARAARGWKDLRATLERVLEAGDKPAEVVRTVIKSSYVDYLENEYPNWRERLEDVEQLANFAEGYGRASDLLAEVSLDDSAFRSPGAKRARSLLPKIVLSTVHQAKGLEWDAVFMIHLTNSAFPNRKAALEEGGLEEERRLFYVAVTRAKRHLYLCYPATMGRDAFTMEQPSSFLEECDQHCLDLGLVDRRFGAGEVGDGFYEEATVSVDDDSPADPFAGMQSRMKKINKDWKKKSFLGDV